MSNKYIVDYDKKKIKSRIFFQIYDKIIFKNNINYSNFFSFEMKILLFKIFSVSFCNIS